MDKPEREPTTQGEKNGGGAGGASHGAVPQETFARRALVLHLFLCRARECLDGTALPDTRQRAHSALSDDVKPGGSRALG